MVWPDWRWTARQIDATDSTFRRNAAKAGKFVTFRSHDLKSTFCLQKNTEKSKIAVFVPDNNVVYACCSLVDSVGGVEMVQTHSRVVLSSTSLLLAAVFLTMTSQHTNAQPGNTCHVTACLQVCTSSRYRSRGIYTSPSPFISFKNTII